MSDTRYRPEEILQILKDSYNFQVAFDPEVDAGEHLTFETTISEWSSICDLIGPKELAKCYYDLFNLKSSIVDLEHILLKDENQLRLFCDYIAQNAVKRNISPITLFGQNCQTAAIFRTLITELKQQGINTEGIKPSSPFLPLFYKHGGPLLAKVSKSIPGTITKFEYQENSLMYEDIGMIFFCLLISAIYNLSWILIIISTLGMVLTYVKAKLKPAKINIGNYNTVRDLILAMQVQLNK